MARRWIAILAGAAALASFSPAWGDSLWSRQPAAASPSAPEFWNTSILVETDTAFNAARTVRLGLYHQLSEELSMDVSLGWALWNDPAMTELNQLPPPPRRYGNDGAVSVGLRYVLTPRLLLTAGVGYHADRQAYPPRRLTSVDELDPRLRVGLRGEYTPNASLRVRGYLDYVTLGAANLAGQEAAVQYEQPVIYQLGISARWTF